MEKIWLKNYPKGIPQEINPDQYQSIPELLDKSCIEFSQDPAFYNLGVTLTFQQFDHLARAFAAYLQQELKLKKGDRIAIMMPNVLQYPIAILGALRAGLIVVNVNPLYTVPELVHQVNDAEVDTIIVLSHFIDTVQQALDKTPLKNVIVTDLGDLFPRPKAWFIHFYLKYIKKQIPATRLKQSISFREAIAKGKTLSLEKVNISSGDVAFLQYTGGTTGVSKGAMLTHRNIVANISQVEAWFSQIFKDEQEKMITALPLYHIFCLTACMFVTKIGGLNILITNPRDISHLISEMSKFKFTVITAVNTLFHGLLNHPKFSKLNFGGLKISLGGGMAVQRLVAEKWKEVTGVPVLEAYGLTETSPCATINPYDLKTYNGTVGLPVSSTDVCFFDNSGHELPINQPGELAVKGPQVMLGYWRSPEETKKVFNQDGWLLTGDIGSINEEGFVRILERKKDLIIVSGFNVYPNEIEDILVQMPGVLEAAVIGISDENSGEVVKAFIVKKDPNITKEAVIKFCRENLTGYKIPRYVEFCKELPKTNVGKILRRALKPKIPVSSHQDG